jgi:hypothetical protein
MPLDVKKSLNVKQTFRRATSLITRLAAIVGVAGATPTRARLNRPAKAGEIRCLDTLCRDKLKEWDDPYRFFCW